MIGAVLTRWLVAILIALLLGHAAVKGDPEALQATADDVTDAQAQAARVARIGDAP